MARLGVALGEQLLVGLDHGIAREPGLRRELTGRGQAGPRVEATVENAKSAPQKAVDSVTSTIKGTLTNVQKDAQAQLDAARREIDGRKR